MNITSAKTGSATIDSHPKKNRYYFNYLTRFYRFLVPQQARVLHIGCRDGYLLHMLSPAYGYGIDETQVAIEQARNRNPQYKFHLGLKSFMVDEPFDYIILSAASLHTHDVQELLQEVKRLCGPDTRLIIDWYSYVWEPALMAARTAGLFHVEDFVNRFSTRDVHDLLQLAGFEVIQSGSALLCPWYIPGLSWFLNNVVGLLPGFKRLGLLRWAVTRVSTGDLQAEVLAAYQKPRSVAVVIACRNERGTIDAAVQRCPTMGSGTEIIFVEGHSHDGTLEEIKRVQAAYPEKHIKYAVQPGKGKADAVRAGCALATSDIIMILDADLTVMPEELPKFYEALIARRGDFINGSRLVYGMEPGAMQFLNLIANHFFSKVFAWLLGQPLTDTLCGTKVFFRKDYERMQQSAFFNGLDPFGDFDLLFGAQRLQSKIINIPVHYKKRVYGSTQIHRFRDGYVLLKMSLYAARVSKMFGR